MDASLKILFYVCFLAVSTGFHLFSAPFKFKTPVGFGLDIGSLKKHFQNGYIFPSNKDVKSFPAMKQCFCFPNNSESQLVTKHLKLDENKERLVVYFYKAGGTLQVFIPNVKKQAMIPDLNFDINEGDVLKPALSNTVIKIFEDSAITLHQSPLVPADKNVNENDKLNLDSIDYNSNSVSISIYEKDIDVIKDIKNNDNESKTEPSKTLKKDDKESDLNETSNNIDSQSAPVGQIDIDVNDQTQKSILSDETSSDISFINTTPMTEIDESTDSEDLFLTVKPSEVNGPKGIQTSTPEEIKPMDLHKQNAKNDNDRLQQILSILPPDSRVYLESLLSQLKIPYSEVLTEYNSITFDDWLKNQLTRVVIQNLDTPSGINALRNRIIEVFENNGMYLTKNGLLTDSSGNVLKLINIKLRPILIGDPVEYQNMLNYQSSPANPMEISYFQVILITQMNPQRLLGLVPLGKVYLPTKLQRKQNIYFLSDPNFNPLHSAQVPTSRGCKTCKSLTILQKNLNPNMKPNFQHSPTTGRGQLRLLKKPENAEDSNIPIAQLSRSVNGETGNNFLNNMGQSLFGMHRAPNMLVDQISQLLPGVKIPLTEPQTEDPDDELPGIRIIGGNPATSSGTPLVAKGRSAFNFPKIFYNAL